MVDWWFPKSKNWTARARLAWEVVMAGQSWLLIIMRYYVYVCVCIVLTSKFHKLYRSYLQTVRKRTCPTQKPPAFQTFYIILPWLELFQSHEFLTRLMWPGVDWRLHKCHGLKEWLVNKLRAKSHTFQTDFSVTFFWRGNNLKLN